MTFEILTKFKTRLRVKEAKLPITSNVLGNMLDAQKLPEGHLSCSKCSGYKFEASGFPGTSKLELGCVDCNERYYVLFPIDVAVPQGRFFCKKHPKKAMILVHNIDIVSVGCEACKTQILFQMKNSNGLVIADG